MEKLSKKKLKLKNRMSVAELKQVKKLANSLDESQVPIKILSLLSPYLSDSSQARCC